VDPHTAPSSAWPFFVPIGIGVFLLGLGVLSAAYIVGGLAMTAIALIGWYRDAGREWRAVEAGAAVHGGASVFPRWLLGVDAVILLMAVLITVGGGSIDSTVAAIHAAASPSTPAGQSGGLQIAAKDIGFSTDQLAAPAGKPFDVTFENQDPLPHNVAIFPSAASTSALFQGEIVTGPTSVIYHVPALKAGTYEFRCEVHPSSMTGTITVR
jgi:plastocyanin